MVSSIGRQSLKVLVQVNTGGEEWNIMACGIRKRKISITTFDAKKELEKSDNKKLRAVMRKADMILKSQQVVGKEFEKKENIYTPGKEIFLISVITTTSFPFFIVCISLFSKECKFVAILTFTFEFCLKMNSQICRSVSRAVAATATVSLRGIVPLLALYGRSDSENSCRAWISGILTLSAAGS